MPRDWEAVLSTWSRPPSDTEDERCANAERMVKEAIRNAPSIAARNIRVFTHGSYRNGTNVKQESDVDVGVCLLDTLYDDYTFGEGLSRADTGITPSFYTAGQFKEELGNALIARFGFSGVTRGRKVWTVRENTYRVHADVAPTFELRCYRRVPGGFTYESGTRLTTDDGRMIDNWPEQHATTAISKNERTGMRFKKLVRIVKRLRDEMTDEGQLPVTSVPSFLIESLLWNAPDDDFRFDTLHTSVRAVVARVASGTGADASCGNWVEINERKYLFRPQQTWTRVQANVFLLEAYARLGE